MLHALVLESVARQLDISSSLARMAPVLFTRTLRPAEPEQLRPATSSTQALAARRTAGELAQRARAASPPASAPLPSVSADVRAGMVEATVASDVQSREGIAVPHEPTVQSALATGIGVPVAADAQPKLAASEPSPGPPPDLWPDATRLSYRLGGRFRSGDLYGSAQVAWQREKADYQVRIDVDITLFASFSMVSQGTVGADRLSPRVFEEIRPGRKRRVVRFDEGQVLLDNGTAVIKPTGIQDSASQFVQLARDFAAGNAPSEVGRTVTVWMARPGGVDLWTYDVVALEEVRSPTLGVVPALHLKPRPIPQARGNITMEMWFAPSLKYLPIRIQLRMGEEALLDLVAEKIEQQ